jgi:NAD(P)-dependent dehydrogenase (short-subunit alcohol dehydrogenase family)
MSSDTPVWFITGCSTGFGRELARAVLKRGYRAVVSARNPDTLGEFPDTHGQSVLVVRLDVTVPEQITAAAKQAEAHFGRIDVLVNNAGYGYSSTIEEGEDAEIRAMFEANVFGLAAMIRAVLPGMRTRRKGHVVNIASVGGLVGNPAVGYYAATKFAVEGLSEALSKEAAPFGVRVTIVEPGPFRTDWAGRSMKITPPAIDDYATTAGARLKALRDNSGKQVGDPIRAAEAMIGVVESANPPLHLILGRPGFEMVSAKLKALNEDMAAWRNVTFGADYPQG